MTAKAAGAAADLPKWHPKNIHEPLLTCRYSMVE
jgi:hypothetical protein